MAKPWRAAFFVLAGIAIIGAVTFALLGSRLLVVRSITVTGTHLVTPAQVIAAANVPAGTPLFRVDPGQVAQRVEAIRQVETVQVVKRWPDGLAITVRERAPVVAVRMAGGGYDLVDHDGVIVRWARSKPAALPLLRTTLPGSALRGDRGVAMVSAVLAELPRWLSRQVAGVSVAGPEAGSASAGTSAPPGSTAGQATPEGVSLYLTGRQTVVWGGADRAEVKARELAIVMRDPARSNPVRYYDVSAPGTVVTK